MKSLSKKEKNSYLRTKPPIIKTAILDALKRFKKTKFKKSFLCVGKGIGPVTTECSILYWACMLKEKRKAKKINIFFKTRFYF